MDHGSPLELRIASSLLHCRQTKNVALLRSLHARIACLGLSHHALLGNYAVPAYVECGSLPDALHLFHRLPSRSEVAWTSVIRGHVELGHPEAALSCFRSMQVDGTVCPSRFTFVSATKACSQLRLLDDGRPIHRRIVERGIEADAFVASAVVDLYARCGSLGEAKKILDAMPARNVVAWNALLAGFAEHAIGGGVEAVAEFLSDMRSEGSLPNLVTYICILKAFVAARAASRGREIHGEIVERGLDSDPCIAAMLVDVYAKCGAFGDATAVIDRLAEEATAVAWNSLISGYVECGLGEEGLECREKMQLRGLPPNSVTFICSLGACGIAGSSENVRRMHAEIVKAGLDTPRSISNALIDAYAKCASIPDARHVLDESPSRCIMSWTAIIAGYAGNGFDKDVCGLLNRMQLEGLVLDAGTYVIVLKALADAGIPSSSFQDLYGTILKTGLDGNIFLGNTLMDLYAKRGHLAEAKAIFDCARSPSLVSWNTLIAGYAENGLAEEALECFERMQQGKTLPDAMTCIAGLKACGCIKHSSKGQELHSLVTKIGLDLALTVGNSLVDMYFKCGLLAEARCAFRLLPTPTTVSWNTIIAGLSEHGLGEEASERMEAMKHEGAGVPWDTTTFVYGLQVCKKNAELDDERTRRLHAEVVTRGLEGHLFIGSALVDAYATCGRLVEARKLFDLLPNRNVVTWTSLVAGYAEHGFMSQALGCLEGMLSEGPSPNAITYACGLKACSSVAALSRGQELHSRITKAGLPHEDCCRVGEEDRIVLTHTLMDMYGKCGAMEDAGKVFDGMPLVNEVSWNTLLTGYARCGERESAFRCIENLMAFSCDIGFQSRLRATGEGSSRRAPDGVVFVAALSVGSHGGEICIRDRCFEAMEAWGVAPTLEHCNCAIDLFARAGQLDEALAMLETMPYQPNLVTWSTLLGACQNWGDVDLARLAFELVASFDEGNAAAFIIMHNMYAEEGGVVSI